MVHSPTFLFPSLGFSERGEEFLYILYAIPIIGYIYRVGRLFLTLSHYFSIFIYTFANHQMLAIIVFQRHYGKRTDGIRKY